jgi:hypothetical protein
MMPTKLFGNETPKTVLHSMMQPLPGVYLLDKDGERYIASGTSGSGSGYSTWRIFDKDDNQVSLAVALQMQVLEMAMM